MHSASDMDPAEKLENLFLSRLQPICDRTALGHSAIQQFYKGCTIFITGGSGYIGRLLIDKLLRSCDVKKIYILLRPKKEKSIHDRLKSLLKESAYDLLRQIKPQFSDKLEAVEGDITEIRLGLSNDVWSKLTDETNIVLHVAATIKFDEPLKLATITNVRGTMETLKLGKACKNLKCFVHISTAFAHATTNHINGDVEEKFYPCPIPPDLIIGMVENIDEDKINAMTPDLISGWPNTYTYTKAIAEELIRINAKDIPICIVKPPVVTSAYIEPAAGWIDWHTCISSPLGALLGIGMGLIHVLLVDKQTVVSYAPVDYVNNAIITAGWDAVENRKKIDQEIPMYTLSSSSCGTKWEYFGNIMRSDEILRLATPKAVWYYGVIETSNLYLYWILTWLLHYIPGYIIDALVNLFGIREKYRIPSIVNIYTRIYKLSILYKYFITNTWNFRDDYLQAMIRRMSPVDRTIYNCNVKTIDFSEIFKAWCVGTRKYIVKDGLRGSYKAYQKQKTIFKFLNYTFLMAYAYVIYFVICLIYKTFFYIISIVF